MEVAPYCEPAELPHCPEHLLAFDLEMANSFRDGGSVICMIGIEAYDRAAGEVHGAIASIGRRDEEQTLVAWLLEQLEDFSRMHPAAALLSFSGVENDLRWLNERLRRFQLEPPDRSLLNTMPHVDLKTEFFKRTQNQQISLKRLEEVFGIARASTVTSKKVSYLLTDIVKKQKGDGAIPERLHVYLREDVHNLLLIRDRWEEISLRDFNLSDSEVVTYLRSLGNSVARFLSTQQGRNGYRKQCAALEGYGRALRDELRRVHAAETLAGLTIPPFPDVRVNNSDFERIVRKHTFLAGLEMVDGDTGEYRLRREYFKPKGALAVVRHEGKVLLIRRSEAVERAAGFWGLPGGVVERDETPEQCAERELMEEVNLSGRAVRTLGSSSSFNNAYELVWVEVEVDDPSTLRPAPQEAAAARWVAPGELASLDPLIPGAVEGFRRFVGPEWAGLSKDEV